jgi:16S rRNA G1207 methylase RsmC
VKVEPMLAAAFGGAQVVADDGRFRVWRAIRA